MIKGIINKKMATFALVMLVIFGTIIVGCSLNSSSPKENLKENSIKDGKALFVFLDKGDLTRVKEMLDLGVNPNIKNSSLQTPLMLAVTKGDLKLVKLLLDYNANMEVTHKLDGKTALIIAVNKNQKEIVKALIEKGANINHKDIYGETALTIAQKKDFKDIANLLMITNSKKDSSSIVELKQYQSELQGRIADISGAIKNLEKLAKQNTVTPEWLSKAQSEMDLISANITVLSQLTPPNGYMKIDEYIRKSFESFNYAQKSLERIIVVKDETSKQNFVNELNTGQGFLKQAENEINIK